MKKKFNQENMQTKVSIQGFKGSFHEQAAMEYFHDLEVELMPAASFEILANQLKNNEVDYAVMAIENSIAGSILQNYRLLRENEFKIEGEIFLRISHCLLANHGTSISKIKEVRSHPMAINQCLDFLHEHLPNARLVETEDTALSAIELSGQYNPEVACIAGKRNANLHELQILAEGIESYQSNYTRFFIIRNNVEQTISDDFDKASLYIRIPDQKGQLLKVLKSIHDHDINMSKLQSYPVAGSLREYFFYIDIEFDHIDQYIKLKSDLDTLTLEFAEMGLYKRANDLETINMVTELQNTNI
jgi:prephenate dehydratase